MIKVFEAFSGVGSQKMALRNLGVEHEVVATSDIDEYAIISYDAIHTSHKEIEEVSEEEMQSYLEKRNIPLNDKGKRKILKGKKLKRFYEAAVRSNNLGDISKIETEDIPDHDLFTYSFPCQDISVAGKGCGLDIGSGTRSGLLWECQKVIQVKKPRYLLLENVKNLVSKKHVHNFEKWLEWLEGQGYKNYWKVVNAKTQGVPQNRERVFVVSILGEGDYSFPEDKVLTLTLDDLLEDEVDEKYYLKDDIQERFMYKPSKTDISILGTSDPSKKIGQRDIVYGTDGIMGSLMASDYKQPKQILRIKNGTKKGYLDAEVGDGVDLSFPGSEHRRGRVQKKMIQTLDTGQTKGVVVKATKGVMRAMEETEEKLGGLPNKFNVYNKSEIKDVSPTVTTNSGKAYSSGQVLINNDLRIRKLTPLECWRLMGFSDEDFSKAKEEMSDTQLYKQAGNSIVVNVLEGIFSQLFKERGE